MPNALLLGYGLDQPSFRHRMRSIVGPLEAAGWEVRMERFPSGRYGLRTWERRDLLRWADVTVLHQIKLSGLEARLIASLTRRRIFDVDDAIYVRKPRRLGDPANDSVWRRRKFAATCRWVDVVAAGNDVLASVARRTARDIAILPTSIDTSSYEASFASPADPPAIAWIGSPENLVYLEMIRPALARLASRHPTLKVRVICSKFPDWPEINVERVAWSSVTEARSLAAAHIGIMPLTDDEWARGKCAFKLLQYMAASLPCVASPVGANTEAVIDGVNGFHARNNDEWERNLQRLIDSANLRARFGAAGHAHVERRYAMRTYQANYVALLSRLAGTRAET
jgi:glycosyltransferase involved in cell wall biosynthesis